MPSLSFRYSRHIASDSLLFICQQFIIVPLLNFLCKLFNPSIFFQAFSSSKGRPWNSAFFLASFILYSASRLGIDPSKGSLNLSARQKNNALLSSSDKYLLI